MAQMKRNQRDKLPLHIARLRMQLHDELAKVGIDRAKVEVEHVVGTKLYRFSVIAPGFRRLRHSERQDLVWRIADQTLDQSQQLSIASIVTATPAEMAGQPAA